MTFVITDEVQKGPELCKQPAALRPAGHRRWLVPRDPAAWAFVCIAVLALKFAWQGRHGHVHSLHCAGSTAAAPAGLYLAINHHKGGTVLTGCLLGSLVEWVTGQQESEQAALEPANRGTTGQRAAYMYEDHGGRGDDVVWHANMLFLRHAMEGLDTRAIFQLGSRLPMVCYDSSVTASNTAEDMKDGLHNYTRTAVATAICEIKQCPCVKGVARCYDAPPRVNRLCQSNIPMGSAPTRVLHVIRNPLDIIISAYLYHRKLPAAEKWLVETKLSESMWLWTRSGASSALIKELRLTLEPHISYGHFIQKVDARTGVLTEALSSLIEIWAMARNHLNLLATTQGPDVYSAHLTAVGGYNGGSRGSSTTGAWWGGGKQYSSSTTRQAVLTVRYEDLMSDHSTSVSQIMDHVGFVTAPRAKRAAMQYMRRCDLKMLSKEELENHDHVTFARANAKDRELLITYLSSNVWVRENICQLQRILGYAPHAMCGQGFGSAARKAREKKRIKM